MSFLRTLPLWLLLIGLSSSPASAAAPRDELVVSAAWLAQHVTDPDLVLLHVSDKPEYDARHLAGARFVSLSAIAASNRAGTGLALEMPPAEDLRRALEGLGISDKSRIIVYWAKGWISPATRVMFTLDYAGLGARTSILDGGMEGWIQSGQPVTTTAPPASTGSLSPLKIQPIVVDAAYVLANLKAPNVAVVDGRTASFYDGVQTGGSPETPHRTGHIAGARSVPFVGVADDQNRLLSPEALRALFDKGGVKPGDTIIGYCHIGQQATAMLFAARTLGHKVLLYDGSFEDWSRQASAPVDNPTEKKPQ